LTKSAGGRAPPSTPPKIVAVQPTHSHRLLNSGYCNLEPLRRRAGDLFIEIHPEDARAKTGQRRRGPRLERARRGARRLLGLRPRPARRRLDAVRRVRRCGRHAARRHNVLTAEEPTDWGGGSGFYDAFVEVAPAD
jgi:hypothetical protein